MTGHTRGMLMLGVVGLIGLGFWGWRSATDERPMADPDDVEQVSAGREIYRAYCADCHGASLEGQDGWKNRRPDGTMPAPPHDDTGHSWHHADEMLFEYTKLGGSAVVPPPFASGMPGFGDRLSDGEIWAVLAFIKSRWSEETLGVQERRNVQPR